MLFRAFQTAFHQVGERLQVRPVNVPTEELAKAGDDLLWLAELVFQYGQNDVQPRTGFYSVSVGDLVVVRGSCFLVEGCGFRELPSAVARAYITVVREHGARGAWEVLHRMDLVAHGVKPATFDVADSCDHCAKDCPAGHIGYGTERHLFCSGFCALQAAKEEK